MITDSFDNKSKPFITAEDFYTKTDRDDSLICIVTYSRPTLRKIVEQYNGELYVTYKTTSDIFEIYSFIYENHKYLVYATYIGAALAATVMYEVATITGCHKFVYFGSCGVLDEEKCRNKIIVPTSSYRDEGISYHYKQASDFIDIRNNEIIASILKENNIPFVQGKIWTTDAFYMETVNKVNKHKAEGVIAVDMEISGVEAVGQYYDIDNYNILFPADSLADESFWQRVDMGNHNEKDLQMRTFLIALLIASKIK